MTWKSTVAAGVLVMSGVAGAQTLKYPAARVSEQKDVYFGTTVTDPYRWMEDVDSAEVKTWVDAENAVTQGFLAGVPARDKIHARLMELSNYERVGMPEREGGRYFYSRNTGLQNQSVLYWQEGEKGEAKVLLDPNTLAKDATIALDSYSVSEDGKLMAYALAEAGSDVQKVRVKVVATGEDLPDLIEWVKFSGVSWAKDGKGFYYSSFGVPKTEAERAAALKQVNTNHKLYFHALGTAQNEDKVVFERPDDKEMLVSGGVSEDGRWLILSSGKGHTNALVVRDLSKPSAGLIQLAQVDDAIYGWVGNVGSKAWLQINKDAPNSKIVEVDLEHPERAAWKTVVAEGKEPIDGVSMVHDELVLSYLEDAKTRVEMRGLDGHVIRQVALPGIGVAHVGGGRAKDTDVFFVFTNYVTPGTVYKLDLKSGATAVWKQPKLVFDPAQYETKQVFAPSKDGTKVPVFITYKKGTKLDGAAPAILYGYGGFNISLGPAYSSSRLAWMEMGGIYAEAILRGGGEYGEKWHEAGTKLQKQNVFDDFIGCAEYLIANKYTSAKKLAINGGSNGGLLVGAVELQRPELFGAVLAQVGVMDMLRFDKFTIGYAWKSDYGSPSDNEAEFKAIYKYSPVHNVHAGTHYPPTLITTADHDDRVFPAHSFKFAAVMQAAAEKTPGAAPMLIRVETRAGHGGGMPLSKQLDVTADMYAFLVKELGMQ
ncbi:prolyl oligopeptidase family serine peptidase [Granulicella tundricola]|uniref:prolyl oligopeptidase n=1 Tax=Granulicella tundricola (strain ATCC BAA-1859 / DSM 23138 / MP5ACTX9) TaxID=1198114 RepID=E8WVT6_GRATM|nr:prolyl oligopeptidase family serine peptidase [Granulicella tundricola]ADW70695.1 Prolyl oligopeptidase [Granulicella tundricola MP5ACTX9]